MRYGFHRAINSIDQMLKEMLHLMYQFEFFACSIQSYFISLRPLMFGYISMLYKFFLATLSIAISIDTLKAF